MSKPYVTFTVAPNGAVDMLDRYETGKDQRAALKHLEPGTFHLMRFMSNGESVVVEEVTERKVTMGDGPEPKKRSASSEE